MPLEFAWHPASNSRKFIAPGSCANTEITGSVGNKKNHAKQFNWINSKHLNMSMILNSCTFQDQPPLYKTVESNLFQACSSQVISPIATYRIICYLKCMIIEKKLLFQIVGYCFFQNFKNLEPPVCYKCTYLFSVVIICISVKFYPDWNKTRFVWRTNRQTLFFI